jgi:predicted dehydrogenase
MANSKTSAVSRRRFLGRAGMLAAAPWIVPAAARGADGAVAPSNRIALASLGVGCMGRGHLRGFLDQPDVQVLAVCDVDRWRRERYQAVVDEHYAAQRASGAYRGCAAYVDMRELLARNDLDAVVIALGERWHPLATILAATAGKDVYVEKPVALTIAEGRAMVQAVRRYGRVCQVGLQQRSQPEFQRACQLVQAGALGKVHTIYTVHNGVSQYVDLPAEPTPETLDWDRWLGPSPWHPFHHRFHYLGEPRNVVPWDFHRDFGTGPVGSGGVHAFDVVQWALGMDESGPVEVLPPEHAPTKTLTFKYPGDMQVQVVDHRLDPQRHAIPPGWNVLTSVQAFGGVYVGERGWIHVGRHGYLTCYPANLIDNHPGRNEHRLAGHYRDWLDAIRARRRPACDIAVGCQSTIVSLLGCIARWTGHPLKWDPATERFIGDDEANRLRRRALREPWHV